MTDTTLAIIREEAQRRAAEQADLSPLVDRLEPDLNAHPASRGPWFNYGGLGFDAAVQLSQAISLRRIADALTTLALRGDFDTEPLRNRPLTPPRTDLYGQRNVAEPPLHSTHPDGWFVHNPGDPCPVAADTPVDVRFYDGSETHGGAAAGQWNWGREVLKIVAWRYHR